MIRCGRCGAQAPAGATHCQACGVRVSGQVPEVLATVPGAGSDVIRLQEGRTVPEGSLAQSLAEAAMAAALEAMPLDADAATVREDDLGSLARAARMRVATLGVEGVKPPLADGPTQPDPAPAGVARLSSVAVSAPEAESAAARRRAAATVNGRPVPEEAPAPKSARPVPAPVPSRAPAAAIPSGKITGPPPKGTLETGEIVDGYRVEVEIGRGGMGRVYRAVHTVTGQTVALKMLLPELADDARLRARFVNEAKVLARLDHPNLVPLLGFLDGARGAFIVMPFVEGHTLEKIVRAEGRLELARTGDLVRQIAEALQYVHGKAVMHRDLKPSNILVRPDGVVKLMDFGIARAIGAERITRAGMVVGTAEYLAPEQASGQAHDDPRSEIYSLAVLAYEMITGRPPFTHPKAAEVLMRHVRDRPPPPRTIRRDLPVAAEAAILKGLEKDPAARFDDAHGFSKAFLRGLASVDDPEAPEPAPAPRGKVSKSSAGVPKAPANVSEVARADTLDPDAAASDPSGRVGRADTLPEVPRKSLLFQIVIGVVLGAALAAGAWQLLLALE